MVSIITPFFGALVDRVGNRLTFIVMCNAVSCLSVLWAMSTPKCDDACWPATIPLILIGFVNVVIFNIQQGSLLAYTVPEERMGMAFGLLYCCLNISYSIFPPILGYVQVHGGYEAAWFILFLLSIFGLVNTLFMYRIDRLENNGILQAKNSFAAKVEDEREKI